MNLHYEKMDEAISPGLTVIRWTSPSLETYIEDVNTALSDLELLIDRLLGMIENRILAPLQEIQKISLFWIPESSAMKATKFCSIAEELCLKASEKLDRKNHSIERVVDDMIGLLVGPEVILEQLHHGEPGAVSAHKKMNQRTRLLHEAENLRVLYEQMVTEAQLKLTKSALEIIRKRLSIKIVSYDVTKKHKSENPLFEASLILAIPNIMVKPSLEDIQQCLNKTVNAIMSVTKSVYKWGHPRGDVSPVPPDSTMPSSHSGVTFRSRTISTDTDASKVKNFYAIIADNKEIQKMVAALSSMVVSSGRQYLTAITQRFSKYFPLWDVVKAEKIAEFISINPAVDDYNEMMKEFVQLDEEIAMEPDLINAGPIALSVEPLKLGLFAETRAWLLCYGHAMNNKYEAIMNDVFKTVEEWAKKLSHPINDLDDIRGIMATLKDIREKEIEIDMSLDPIEVL